MNPEIHWPIGADPRMLMDQTHDTQLLEAELRKGRCATTSMTHTFKRCFGGMAVDLVFKPHEHSHLL